MNLRSLQRRAARAFTLIEVMIAMAILAVIITSVYSCWTAIIRGAQAGNLAAAQVQRTRISERVLQDSFGSVVMFTQNATNYSFTSDTSGDFASVSMVSHLSPNFPGSGFFPDQPTRRVSFDVETGDGGRQLVMRQSTLLQNLDNPDDAYAIILATNVSAFTLEFYDPSLNDWAFDWTATNTLPKAVRFALAIGGNSKLSSSEDTISMVVALPAVAVARQDQIPDAQGAGGPGGRPRSNQPGNPNNPNNKEQRRNVPAPPVRPGFNFK